MNKEQMAAHVAELAKANNIHIYWSSHRGCAFRKLTTVKIRPVRSAVTYAVALHELGHVLGPMQTGRRLFMEAGAWLWARDNASVWTDAMTRMMVKCLRSYERTYRHLAKRRPGNPPVFPPEGHDFWRLIELGERLK